MRPGADDLEMALLARRGRRVGDEVYFSCPAHDDAHPSATFNLGKGVGTCHGCGAKWTTVALRRRLNLPPGPRQIFPRSETTYDYRDETGDLVYQTVRVEPGPAGRKKQFFQRRPDGAGGWINNLQGVRRVVYRLPDLVAADPKAPVFVVEGEKDVDRLRAAGLIATCNVGGAGKWRSDYSRFFAGRVVIVIADHDDAGRAHADDVVAALQPVAATVRRLDLPGLAPKGDVSDWLDGGGTVEDLLAQVAGPNPGPAARASGDDGAWQRELVLTEQGSMRKLGANVEAVLAQHPDWVGRIAFDEFGGSILLLEKPPDGLEDSGDAYPRPWCDDDTIRAAHWFQRAFKLDITESLVASAVIITARRRMIHPVRDYLSSLTWDRVARLDSLFQVYAGAEASDFAAKAGARFLIQAVARVRQPGCQADSTVVVEGEQGSGKSTFARVLCPHEDWFADELADLDSKDAPIGLRGKWIIEISELDALRGKPGSRIKAFLTRRVDHYRSPYGRIAVSHPRQSVFIGTTNSHQYLHDETGARRFWPVRVGQIDIEALRRDRDQLWAEAVVRYEKREPWWFSQAEFPAAAEVQDARFQQDPWEPLIEGWLASRPRTTMGEVLDGALKCRPIDVGPREQARVAKCLQRLGYARRRGAAEGPDGRRPYFYERATADTKSQPCAGRPTPSHQPAGSGTANSSASTGSVPPSHSVPLDSEEPLDGGNLGIDQTAAASGSGHPGRSVDEDSGTPWDGATPLAGQGPFTSPSTAPSHQDEILL